MKRRPVLISTLVLLICFIFSSNSFAEANDNINNLKPKIPIPDFETDDPSKIPDFEFDGLDKTPDLEMDHLDFTIPSQIPQIAPKQEVQIPEGLNHWDMTFGFKERFCLTDLIFENGMYIATGYYQEGTPPINKGYILSSPDGVKWSEFNTGKDQPVSAVCYGDGKYVALSPGNAFISSNGYDWESIDVAIPGDISCMVYGNGQFIACLYSGNTALMSESGRSWTTCQLGGIGKYDYFTDLTYGNGLFMGVVRSDFLVASTNGTNWTRIDSPAFTGVGRFLSVAYCGDKFYATARSGRDGKPYKGFVFISPNGLTWTNSMTDIFASYRHSFSIGDRVIVVDLSDSLIEKILLSPINDGGWLHIDMATTMQEPIIIGANGAYVMADRKEPFLFGGSRGPSAMLFSKDLVTWSDFPQINYSKLRRGIYGNNTYVLFGDNGAIATSSDGRFWRTADITSNEHLNDMVYGNDKFIVVGTNGEIQTSNDGVTWTKKESGTEDTLNGIAYGNNLFVAVGSNGTLLTSSNGSSWNKVNLGTDEILLDIIYADNKFVATGGHGCVLVSENGTVWTRNTICDSYLSSITYGKNMFVAIETEANMVYSSIYRSYDGINWTKLVSSDSKKIPDSVISYGNGLFVGDGYKSILLSNDALNWVEKKLDFNVRNVFWGDMQLLCLTYDGLMKSGRMPLDSNSFDYLSPPGNLRIDSKSGSSVKLSWSDTNNSEKGFRIERRTGLFGCFSIIGTVGPGATSFTDSSVTPGSNYYYRVRAYNDNVSSSYSNIVNALL